MISLNDIKAAVIRQLHDGTGIRNIYGNDIKNKAFPLFQVTVVPLSGTTAAAGCHVDKSILVDILYMEEDFTSCEQNYEILDLLDHIIRPTVPVADRKLTVENAVMEITDYVAHYKFYLNFTDTESKKGNEESLPFMKELEVRLKEGRKYGIT